MKKRFRLVYGLKGYYPVDEPELKIEGAVTATYYMEAHHWHELIHNGGFLTSAGIDSPDLLSGATNLSGDARSAFPALEWELIKVELVNA